jgi:hypothetical protein
MNFKIAKSKMVLLTKRKKTDISDDNVTVD